MVKKLLVVGLACFITPCVAENRIEMLQQKCSDLVQHPNVVHCKQEVTKAFHKAGPLGYMAVGAFGLVFMSKGSRYVATHIPNKADKPFVGGALLGLGVWLYQDIVDVQIRRIKALYDYNNKLRTAEAMALQTVDHGTVAAHYNALVELPTATAATGKSLKDAVVSTATMLKKKLTQ